MQQTVKVLSLKLEYFQRLLLVRPSCLETVFEVYTGEIKI